MLDSSALEGVSSSSLNLLTMSSSLAEAEIHIKAVETDVLITKTSKEEVTPSDELQPEADKPKHSETPRTDILQVADTTTKPDTDNPSDKKLPAIYEITDKTTTPTITDLTEHATTTPCSDSCWDRGPAPVLEITDKNQQAIPKTKEKTPPPIIDIIENASTKHSDSSRVMTLDHVSEIKDKTPPQVAEVNDHTTAASSADTCLENITPILPELTVKPTRFAELPQNASTTTTTNTDQYLDKRSTAISKIIGRTPSPVTGRIVHALSRTGTKDHQKQKPPPAPESTDKEPQSATESTDKEPQSANKTTDKEPQSASKITDKEPQSASKITDKEPQSTSKITDKEPQSASKITDKESQSASEGTDKEPQSASEVTDKEPQSASKHTDKEPQSAHESPDIAPTAVSEGIKHPSLEVIEDSVQDVKPKQIVDTMLGNKPAKDREKNPPPVSPKPFRKKQTSSKSFAPETEQTGHKLSPVRKISLYDKKWLPISEKTDTNEASYLMHLDKKRPLISPKANTSELAELWERKMSLVASPYMTETPPRETPTPTATTQPYKNKEALFLEKKPPPNVQKLEAKLAAYDKAILPDKRTLSTDVTDSHDETQEPIYMAREQTPSPGSTSASISTTTGSSTSSSSSSRHNAAIAPSNLFISASGSRDDNGSSGTASSHVFSGRVYHVGQYIPGNRSNLQVVEVLGCGTQATVYKVNDGSTTYAAKISCSDEITPELLSEFKILSSLIHKNVIAVHGKIPRGILMDCLSDDLKSFITTSGNVQPKVRDRLAKGILQGVDYIHRKGIAHLDIKPENILLTNYGIPKLCDFGLAVRYWNDDGSMIDIGRFHGTAHYASPEMYRKGWFASEDVIDLPKTDCWSVGVTLFKMMTGQPLFTGNNEMEIFQNQRGNKYNYPPMFENLSPVDVDYYEFMEMIKCLCKNDAEARFSTREALDHECFQ